jgi:intracellular multiplication protein IcmK
MRPNEIRKLLERYDQTRQAVETPIYPYPEPQSMVESISLDPGIKPPEIKVAVGQVTTISVLDVTGQPWPIQDVSWAGKFEIQTPEAGGNIIRIAPMTEFTYGNISLRLLGLKVPVTFVLHTHRDEVYYRYDARITQFGPFARPPLVDHGAGPSAGTPELSSVLDGIAPSGFKKMTVSGVDGRTTAYSNNSQTYVRTPLTLLSPGWSDSARSADGTNVYILSQAPVLLLSDNGQMVRAQLTLPDFEKDENDQDNKSVNGGQGKKDSQ